MEPLRVTCYSDGRPGHEKQSLAVVSALASLTPLTVTDYRLPEAGGFRRLFQGLMGLAVPFQGQRKGEGQTVDLIIGTGSTTHLPMLGLRLKTGARLVTCMLPDPLLRPWFDLCLVPRHDQALQQRRIFQTFGPPCQTLRTDGHDDNAGLILAGGIDPKSHRWDTSHFISQIDRLVEASPDIRWTISSSPRTPADTLERLAELAESSDTVVFFRAEQTPRGWIESAYETHDQVWVTADSVSMVYEALTAGCRVGVLPVKWKKAENKFQNGIDDLKQHGMIVDFEQWARGVKLPAASSPLDEAGRCAREILRRWWPKRLK